MRQVLVSAARVGDDVQPVLGLVHYEVVNDAALLVGVHRQGATVLRQACAAATPAQVGAEDHQRAGFKHKPNLPLATHGLGNC